MGGIDAKDLTDEELYALLDNAEAEAKKQPKAITPFSRNLSFLSHISEESRKILEEGIPDKELAARINNLLVKILSEESKNQNIQQGFSSMMAQLGGGSFALRVFTDLFFKTKEAAENSHKKVSFNKGQILSQFDFVVKWYLTRIETLTKLNINLEGKYSKESEFLFNSEIVDYGNNHKFLRVTGAASISGFAGKQLTAKLILKYFKKSVGLRAGWESWAENLKAYLDEKEYPRAVGIYIFTPEQSRTIIDKFTFDFPLAALDLPAGIHQLQPVFKLEEENGKGLQRSLVPIDVEISPKWAVAPIIPSAQLAKIFAEDWQRGDRLYNVKVRRNEDIIEIGCDLDLISREQEALTLMARFQNGEATWLKDQENKEIMVKLPLKVEAPFIKFQDLKMDIGVEEIEISKKLNCELRLIDNTGKTLLGGIYLVG